MKCILVKADSILEDNNTEQSFQIVETEWRQQKESDGTLLGWMLTVWMEITDGTLKLDAKNKKPTVLTQNYCFYGGALMFTSDTLDKFVKNFELWFDEDSAKDRKALDAKLIGTKFTSRLNVNAKGFPQLGRTQQITII
jgi:hypothetical protein